MQKIAVLDYGMGNLHSVAKAIEKVIEDHKVFISRDLKLLEASDKMVIPGVGAIGDCIKSIKNLGMDDLIRRFSEEKPILGVCVGMQILLKESEESGRTKCLGLVDGVLEKLNISEDIKVPHIGWEKIKRTQKIKVDKLYKMLLMKI